MADQAKGGQGNVIDHAKCVPGRMPWMMSEPSMEFIVTPETTYIATGSSDLRRIFTDGRPWPTDLEPTYQGYAVGQWKDTSGNGHYDLLDVETRGPFKGPRSYDATGLPLHFDNQSIFKERLHLDKNDPNLLQDENTVFDHALTRPLECRQNVQARTPTRIRTSAAFLAWKAPTRSLSARKTTS